MLTLASLESKYILASTMRDEISMEISFPPNHLVDVVGSLFVIRSFDCLYIYFDFNIEIVEGVELP